MSDYDPIELLFGGMEKLGPGGNLHTLRVLDLLPHRHFQLVLDAGCGTGRQTLALAERLGTLIYAIDLYEPFLLDLRRRSELAGLAHLVQPLCMDMRDIARMFHDIDLLWSEGAAYHIGFAAALADWARAVTPEGFLVVSELSWIQDPIPNLAREFFASGYPDMQPVSGNIEAAEKAGCKVLDTYTLPREAWIEGYYDILEHRAQALIGHPETSVREFAAETLREIEVFEFSQDSYGYVFYVLQRSEHLIRRC